MFLIFLLKDVDKLLAGLVKQEFLNIFPKQKI